MAASKIAVAAMVGSVMASNLATIAPCTQAPGMYPDEVVTAQFQPVSYCVPTTTVEYSTSTAVGYGSSKSTTTLTTTKTIYPLASTSVYVSTVIPCSYGAKGTSSCTVTTTNQNVECRETSSTITSYKPYQTTTVIPVTITGPKYYGGNGTYANSTTLSTKTVTSTETHYTTISKHYDADYNNIGDWIIPGYSGAPICSNCGPDAQGAKHQALNVTECKQVDSSSAKCSQYVETWISKPVPSSTSVYSTAVSTHASVSSAGIYSYTFKQTAPAATYTAPASGSYPSTVVTAPAQTFTATVTTSCSGPTTFDITSTVSKTITYTCPYEHTTPKGQTPTSYYPTGGYPTGGSGSYPTGGSPSGGSGSYPTGGSPSGGSGSYPTGGSPSGGSGSYPTGGSPSGSGSYPTGGSPSGSGSYPTGGSPSGSGSYPTGGSPSGSGSYPTGGGPSGSGSYPTGGGPSGSGSYPTGGNPTGGYPTSGNPTGSYPTGCPTNYPTDFKLAVIYQGARFQKSQFVGFDGDDAIISDTGSCSVFDFDGSGDLKTESEFISTEGSSKYAPFEKTSVQPMSYNKFSIGYDGYLDLAGANGFCVQSGSILIVYGASPNGCQDVKLKKQAVYTPPASCITTTTTSTTATITTYTTSETTTTTTTSDISGDYDYPDYSTTAPTSMPTYYAPKKRIIRRA